MKCEKPLLLDMSVNSLLLLSFFYEKHLPGIYFISNFVSNKKMYLLQCLLTTDTTICWRIA